jgi:hypothetical protein
METTPRERVRDLPPKCFRQQTALPEEFAFDKEGYRSMRCRKAADYFRHTHRVEDGEFRGERVFRIASELLDEETAARS